MQPLTQTLRPRSFPLFPTLLTELRLKIWSFFLSITLPTPITIIKYIRVQITIAIALNLGWGNIGK
jgi:hypothetical protein